MKKNNLTFYLILLSSFLFSAPAFAAPNIDGLMTAKDSNYENYGDEWYGHEAVEPGGSYGDYYDIEKLGLWIDDGMLYIGLQTDFQLDGGWATSDYTYRYDEYGNYTDSSNRYVDPGDFAFDFGNDGTYEAGIDFQIDNGVTSLTFFTINSGDWMNPVYFTYNKPYSAAPNKYTSSQTSGTGTDQFTATSVYSDDNDRSPGDVLEIAINLDTLSSELSNLFVGNTEVGLHWTMECGNDELKIGQTYKYDSPDNPNNPVPEPETFLLFGMGLLGVGAFGRKKNKKGDPSFSG